MDSSEVPPSHQENSECDVCNVECKSRERLNMHYDSLQHMVKSRDLTHSLFGYLPERRITCLDDMFSDPSRKGFFIGLHYLKCVPQKGVKLSFTCDLCCIQHSKIFMHLTSIRHKKKYICKRFPFLFRDVKRLSSEAVEEIAEVIDEVEGIQMFKIARKIPLELPDCVFKQTLEKIVAQFIKRGTDFINPYAVGNNVPCLDTGLHSSETNEKKLTINPSVPSKQSADSESTSRQVNDKMIEKQQIHQIGFKDTYRKDTHRQENGVSCLDTGSHSSETNKKKLTINPSVPSEQSADSESTSRQVNDKIIEKQQVHQIDFKDTCRKATHRQENAVSCLDTGSHSSETNEKKLTINSSVPSEQSADSESTSRQVSDKIIEKRQIHQIDFKDTYRKDTRRQENAVSCLETGSHASGINGKRPSQFTPLAAFKRCKSELAGQFSGQPIVSLSRPVPVPFSIPHKSVGVPVGNERNSSRASNLPTISYIPRLINGIAPKPIPSLCRSYQATSLQVEEPFPSWPPAHSFYQSAEGNYGYYSDQSLYGFANQSAYGQASSVSDVGQAYGYEGQTWGQETGHSGSNHLHTIGTISGSVSPPKYLSGQCSTEASLKQAPTSRYGYNSVDSKEWSSKCSSSRIISVLNKEPSLSKSLGDVHPPEALPPTISTSLYSKTPKNTHSSMPVETASILSPDTLKILQGRDPTVVKSILKRLAEYCPELQQVNISLLVDILFESGALH